MVPVTLILTLKVLSFTVSVHFAPADISRQQLSHQANMSTSGVQEPQTKSTSSTAASEAEKSNSKSVEEPVGKSASNKPERVTSPTISASASCRA